MRFLVKRKLCIFSICIVILLLWPEKLNKDIFDRSTCPACYGSNCNITLIHDGNFVFLSHFKLFNLLFNIKNVFYFQNPYGTYVLKKLAHSAELQHFDDLLTSLRSNEEISILPSLWNKSGKNIQNFLMRHPQLFQDSEMLKCNHSRVINFALQKFEEFDTSADRHLHFLSLVAINPEPILLLMFSSDFPFPHLFGCCGRIVVEEYGGMSLKSFYYDPWEVRAKLAAQLLKMAIKMSENDIRMYLTDPSADNFAVDEFGVVRLIDVENVILVDPLFEGIDQRRHQNNGIGCPDCLSYSYEDLCGHVKSDHNYFAICKGLLSSTPFSDSMPGGLLHNIPEAISSSMPALRMLIEECSWPKHMKREGAAKRLLQLLNDL